MANCLFADPDRTLSATLSGGSWSAGLPLANLKDRLTTKVARTTNALAASTKFDLDLGALRNLRLLALLYGNLSTAATVRWQLYTDSGYTQLVHDTGALPVPWAAIDAETLTDWRPDFHCVLPSTLTARYLRVEILDTANAAGYIEIGRALAMPAWQPAVNIAYGNPLHYDHSATVIERALGGPRYAGRRRPLRLQHLELPSLSSAEAHQAILEMQRTLGRDGELFFVHDPDASDFYLRQRSFLATMDEANPLEQPYFANYASSLTLLETT